MARALITGISGQDGSYLAEFLLSKGYQVAGLLRRVSGQNTERIKDILPALYLYDADIGDIISVERALLDFRPDEVYNLAAQSHVRTSFEQPHYTFNCNTGGLLNLLSAVRIINPDCRVFQASTSEMFGNSGLPCQDEDTPLRPCSPYAVSKVAAHHLVKMHREAYGMYCCSAIMFNHESPRRGIEFVTRSIARGVARIHAGIDQTLDLGNIESRRDWGYAGDYVQAMWLMLQQSKPQDFVIATGETHSVQDFVAAAFAEVGMNWQNHIAINSHLYRPLEVETLCGNPSRACQALGWTARVKFQQLVSMMVSHEVRNLKILL